MVPGNASRASDQDLKVLHVIPSVSDKHGGPSYAIRLFAKASRQAGIEVVVATTDDDGDCALLDVSLNEPVERDGATHFFFRRDFLPYKISLGLAQWLNRHVANFDIIHIHALFSFSSFVAARAAWRNNIPYIVRPLGVLDRWGIEKRRPWLKRLWLQLIELPLLRRAAAVHYTTEAERHQAEMVHPDIAGLWSFVLPIPIEVRPVEGDKSWFLQQFPKSAGKKLILFLSRLDKKKGVELLLRAYVEVKQSEPDSFLIVAGNGDRHYVDSLHQIAHKLQIEENVLWTGFLGPAEKSAAFAAATLFVLPSLSENFGIVAAEALAAGVPCVLSDQVALIEYLRDKDSALVVPCDSAAIANALCQLLSEPEMREHLATQGRQVAAQWFSLQSVGEGLAERYRSILGSGNIPENAL